MFERATVTHPGITNGRLDLGRVLDTMLYYDRVGLIVDARVFTALWQMLGRDGIESLLKHPSLHVELTPESPGIFNNSRNYVMTHRPVYIVASGREGNLIKPHETDRILHQMISNSADVRLSDIKRVTRGIPEVRYKRLMADEVKNNALFESLIQDTASMRLFLRRHVEIGGGRVEEDEISQLQVDVIKVPDGYIVTSNVDLSRVAPGHKFTAGLGDILPGVMDYVHDLYISQTRSTDVISSAELGSIADARVDLSVARAIRSEEQISSFEKLAFKEARPFGQAFNDGRISLHESLNIIDQSRKFREWLTGLPPSSDLVCEYHRAITKDTILEKLPGSLSRFSFFTGGGMLLDMIGTGGLGTAAGLGLSAFDAFVLDRLVRGWRPNVFVENIASRLAPH